MLKKHLEPTLPILAERFTFHCCSQGNSESIAAYVAELKRLTTHCKFEAYLDKAFRDRFVFELKITAIQIKLLAEKTLSFTTAVRDHPEYGKHGPTGKNQEGGRTRAKVGDTESVLAQQ